MSDDDEIRCPFCDEADGCKHLVASFDHENAAIGGGLFCDREEKLAALIREHFVARSRTSEWRGPSAFAELWEDFRQQPEEPLDSGLLAHLLDRLLRDTDAICEGEEGVVAFFDPKPEAVYAKVVKAVQRACEAPRG